MNEPPSPSLLDWLDRLAANGRLAESPAQLLSELAAAFGCAEAGLLWTDGTSTQHGLKIPTDVSPPRPESYSLQARLPIVNGCVWLTDVPTRLWTTEEQHALTVAARFLGRALAATYGPPDSHDLTRRLADAATISGRMAHDFDNLLQGVLGFADLTLSLLPSGSQAHQFVNELLKVGQQGVAMTQQMHHLSRGGTLKANPSPADAPVASEERRVRPLLPEGATLQITVESGLPQVMMDSSAVQQVLGILLDNAREATPKNGRIQLAVRSCDLTAEQADAYLGRVRPGRHVEYTISDEGPGIPPETRRRLFLEPFYTTKPRRRGLGLAIAFRVLSTHHGGLMIHSVAGQGTRANFVVPVTASV